MTKTTEWSTKSTLFPFFKILGSKASPVFLAFLTGRKSIFACFNDQEGDRVGWKTVDAAFLTQQSNTVGKMGAFRSLFVGY